MNYSEYESYVSLETLMGPNSIRVIGELLEKHPVKFQSEDEVLDLGCGRGLSSLVIAKETGAKVYANDLWVKAQDNQKLFSSWGMEHQLFPFCEDANKLQFEKNKFQALFSIDSYHYFAGTKGYFQEKLLPFLRDNAIVLIGIPGIKDAFSGRSEELLTQWLGDEAYMFKSPSMWKEIIGQHERIKAVETWEMDCFDCAWEDWLKTDNPFAQGDKKYFDTVIKPYTCFVGIFIQL